MQERKPLVIACIPAKDVEDHIAGVILRCGDVADKIVVCDDGSHDLTGDIAKRLGADVIKHDRNLGYGAALRSLFERAREMKADIMVTLDGDGQHDPSQIPRLVQPIKEGTSDIVIGSRFLESESKSMMPQHRQIGVSAINAVSVKSSFPDITDSQCGLRAYGKRAIDGINPTEMGMGASTEILLQARDKGLTVSEIPVQVKYGVSRSTLNPGIHGLDVVFSTVKQLSIRNPLLFYGVPGVFFVGVGLFFGVWTLELFSSTRQVVTNLALIAIGATILGAMLLVCGVLLWVIVSVVREKQA